MFPYLYTLVLWSPAKGRNPFEGGRQAARDGPASGGFREPAAEPGVISPRPFEIYVLLLSQKAAGVKHCTEDNQASERSRTGGVLGGASAGKCCCTKDALRNDAKAKSSFSEVSSLELLSGKMEMGLVVQGGKGPSAASNGPVGTRNNFGAGGLPSGDSMKSISG